jgi:hypothetical protein
MTRITSPGIYEMPAADYHADPCEVPSLSASVAHILDTQSARHAWAAHPRLAPHDDEPEDTTSAAEEGKALHSLILEREDRIVAVDAADWRTKAAKEERDAAREKGMIPLLVKRAKVVRACAASALEQIGAFDDPRPLFPLGGKPEAVMVWTEETVFGQIMCRSRVDWLLSSGIDDLKTTAGDGHPMDWSRKVVSAGYALQAAFYIRGAQALGMRPKYFRFVVLETKPPFGLSVVELGAEHMALAMEAVERTMEAWAWSIANDSWPSYPNKPFRTDPKPWETGEAETRHQLRRGYMHSDAAVLKAGMPFA